MARNPPLLIHPWLPCSPTGERPSLPPPDQSDWGKLEVDNFLCVVSEYLQSDVEKEESVPFLDEVNPQVWDVSSPGLAINVPPVKILLRPNAPTPGKDNIP